MQTRLLFRPLATLLRSRTALCTSKSSLRAFSSTTIRAVSVDKKTVLITGGSRGIGSAIATLFAHNGASCILVGRNRPTLVDVASGLRQEPGDERHWSHVHGVRVGDVSSREFWEELRKDEKVKEVDILVNVAGITHSSLLVNSSADMLEDVVRTNLMGTIWGCKYLGKNMMRRKTGCIVNVGSLLGVKGGSGSTVYAASKAGIVGLTRSLAAELGPGGVRVNCVLPGYIETEMTEAMTPEAKSEALNAIPLKRFGTTKEVADAAYFLATNDYASNCILNLDGALSAT